MLYAGIAVIWLNVIGVTHYWQESPQGHRARDGREDHKGNGGKA